ncbi:unnamed protein product [Paramecium sonneborni]|uniref:Uncharacterized protein n=1 Tax=Paramecium sonneborni TaxID=65129 RepID=A0A8S1R3Y5_9CILI|nr:unnamed protein product [Paramecium sonneborni]
MNHVSLSWQCNLIQILTSYTNKYEQMSNTNQQLDEIFQNFVQIYSNKFQQKEFEQTLISQKILKLSQEKMQQEQLLQTQGQILDSIREQRERLLQKLDEREQEQTRIEKVLESSNKRESEQHKFEDLQDGILMCKEKCVLLQEENIEFTKLASSLRQENDQLKIRYSQVRQTYDNNLLTLNELQQHGLNLNYRMMKFTKIIKDLVQLNQCGISQSRKTKLENFVSNYSQLEDTCITQLNSF